MGYKTIKDQLVTILQGVTSLKVVYGKEEKAVKQFPAACVSAKEHTSEFSSVGVGGQNERIYRHFVRIYFRTDEANDPDYEDILETVADDVITAIEHNVTLNGTCEYALPTSGVWRFAEKESPVRVLELVVSSHLHVTR